MSVAKRRSPRRAAQSKARRSEPDEDLSPADLGDEDQLSGGTVHSPDDSNYSDDEYRNLLVIRIVEKVRSFCTNIDLLL